MIRIPKCKRFTGYRPCAPYRVCRGVSEGCSPFDSQWLLLAPEKSGTVLSDPDLLHQLEIRHPRTQIIAVAHPDEVGSFASHPLVDLAFPASFETVCMLNVLRFDRIHAPGADALTRALFSRLSGPPGRFLMVGGELADLLHPTEHGGPGGRRRILIINLDALGDVLMTTSILPAIKRAFPDSSIDWLTDPYATEVLRHNPFIDRVLPFCDDSVAEVLGRGYDLLISVDKGRRSCAAAELLSCPDKRGYGMNGFGQITFFNPEAEYAYRLGLDDHEKFRMNRKTGQQLLAESMGLEYCRDPYILVLTDEEKRFVAEYRAANGISSDTFAVGFNTGCSEAYPNKKLTIGRHVALIRKIGEKTDRVAVLLLGGKQETGRNSEIARRCGEEGVDCRVIETPTVEGLRRGILYIAACDALVTGDTSALHIGIALGLYTVSWYGTSCWTEIDLYDNGVKFYPEGLDCSPCWKSACTNVNRAAGLPECLARVDLDKMADIVKKRSAKVL